MMPYAPGSADKRAASKLQKDYFTVKAQRSKSAAQRALAFSGRTQIFHLRSNQYLYGALTAFLTYSAKDFAVLTPAEQRTSVSRALGLGTHRLI
jgi:hypothetical protein